MQKLIIYSDNVTERFAKGNYPYTISRDMFHRINWFPLLPKLAIGNRLPIFLSWCQSNHHFDFQNINNVVNSRPINKEDLSLEIFDYHTDMYLGLERSEELNMGNWVLHLINNNYSDISIVGVVDFTRTSSFVGSQQYENYIRYKEQVSFFLGKDFDKKIDFKEWDSSQLKLKSLEDFLKKPLRKYSFVSLDCDVSCDFANPVRGGAIKIYGVRGEVTIDELREMINYINKHSEIIGLSIHFIGFQTDEKKWLNNVKSIIDLI
jgi:hypothetical protein